MAGYIVQTIDMLIKPTCLINIKMPTIQIYLNQELFDLVKHEKSKIVQLALKEYKQRHATENTNSSPNTCPDCPA